MTAVETIPRATVWAALEALGIPPGEPFNRTMVVHIAGDHISYEQADGQTILWRRVVAECPSCHSTPGQPHTEYCQLAGRVVPVDRPECGHATWPACQDQHAPTADPWTAPLDGIEVRRYPGDPGHQAHRPEDDPADEITCDGRNCGGRPHA
ncbi:hypothetical protein [Kribbella sp. NPDC023855]|uniref:hypothetical protein n=1 Tax=Kribbella sp. NPDC023855 TaxID=3154698 RepID=UPI0033C8B275